MVRNNPYFVRSPQQIDPLSWFTGPLVPLAFAAFSALYGGLMIGVTWTQGLSPLLQAAALSLCVGADVLIHVATRPLRQPIGWAVGAAALLLSGAGMVLSAVDYAGGPFSLELWWAPVAFSLTIGSLGPYLPVRKLLVLGVVSITTAVVLSILVLHPATGRWGPVGSALIAAYPPALGLAATVTFAYMVVSTMMPMLESPSRIMVAGQAVRDEAADMIERVTLARLSARATPFLERIADAGRIEAADRALAGQLARRLRDELITQSNLSWLDSIASESRLVVVDPEHLARRMNNAQRTALRGLLRAFLDIPATDSRSLLVELRKTEDGAIAVALSLDMALPEGTRIMHLAPYYLTLKTAVRDMVVQRDKLGLRFNVDPEDPGTR
ncbi:hypothetical protein BH11ACT4_BH11ACT4_20190 [soil metagenome]